MYIRISVCVPGYTTWEACVSYIGVVVPAENGVRRPPIGLPLAGPGVARCSHRFRQSLADSAPAAILNDSGINTRGAEKKVHAGPPPSPGSLGRISRPFYLRLHATTALPRSLSINRFMQPPTPLHHLLFPPRGTLTPFRRRLPPVPPFLPARRYRSSSDGIPGATTPTIDDPVEGGDRAVHMYTRGGTHACTIHIRGLENHRKNTRRKRGCRCSRRRYRRPRPSPPRSTVIFFSPPGFVSRVYAILSRSLACALLRCTLRFQHRPTRREIGNLKSKLRTVARRAHPRPRPSFSRITLDHR